MTRTLRGGNSKARVRRQKVHAFSESPESLERKTKDELVEIAEDLDVYDDVPRNGSSNTPLVDDLRAHLARLAGVQLP